ncbi:MAPEG family protein [Massilia sp. CMS3.1]|uniref:MAPEG family protein n=1 Tax=Massilia sp. CMS3.1 TaxID=3373083 RepID=UPI003EE4F856
MNAHLIFGPLLAQMLLTLGMFGLLAARKAQSVRLKKVDLKQAALDHSEWPAEVVKVSNNIANQFETPILFYIVCLALFQLNAVSAAVLMLAWLYVATRCVHGFVHVRSNLVPIRLRAFSAGLLILFVLMLVIFWELAHASGN